MLGSRRKTAAIIVAALIIALGAGWYFLSPAWTLRGMKAAAEANDPAALDAYIDYPAVREDLKAEIMAQLMAEAQKDRGGFGGLGMAIGSAMIGPMIDGMVSPAGMRAALIAKRNQPTPAKTPPGLAVPAQPVIVRRSFSEYQVASKDQPNSGLVFKLHGLSWKLSGVDLPPDTTKHPA
jgi:hypothetical protein